MNTLEVTSHISRVTVYADRAQVQRSAKVSLEEGENKIILRQLPDCLDPDSLQVGLAGSVAVLRDVRLHVEDFHESQHAARKELEAQKAELLTEKARLEAKAARIQKAMEQREAIFSQATSPETPPPVQEPEAWLKLLNFLETEQARLDEENLKNRTALKQLEDQLEALNEQIRAQSPDKDKRRFRAEVFLENSGTGEAELELRYIVHRSSWRPVYDLRVESEARRVQISCHAVVSQHTGEDWENAQIFLSTAKANVSGEAPKLNPLKLFRYAPPAKNRSLSKKSAMPAKPQSQQLERMKQKVQDEILGAAEPQVEAPAPSPPPVTVDPKASSVLYRLSGTHDIKSNKQDHRLTILHQDFEGEFRYVCVPSVSSYAYLKAKIKNRSEFELLSGKAHVFMDGHFVARTGLPFVPVGGAFEVSLGIDASIHVEHKLLEEFRSKEGLISKREKKMYVYQTTLKNPKPEEIQIELHERIPKSMDEDIRVELLQPKLPNETPENPKTAPLYLSEEALLVRRERLPAEEEKQFLLKYTVDYPLGTRVSEQ